MYGRLPAHFGENADVIENERAVKTFAEKHIPELDRMIACMIHLALLLSGLVLSLVALPPPSWAYRDYFTTEQKALLEKIQTLRIEAIALTDKGAVDARPSADVLTRRMSELGFTVVREPGQPHDAVVKVK